MKRSMYACGTLFAAIGVTSIAASVASGGEGAVGTVPFGLMFLACAALFFWVGGWAALDTSPLAESDLPRLGRPAAATVLEVGDGGRLTLRVTPVNEPSFRAKAPLAPSRPAPRVGDALQVRFDPNKRKHLIVLG